MVSIGNDDQRSLHDAMAAASYLERDFRSAEHILQARSKVLENQKTMAFKEKGVVEEKLRACNKSLVEEMTLEARIDLHSKRLKQIWMIEIMN